MHSVTQLWLIWKSSIKTKSLNTKPCPAGLSPRIICQTSPFLPKMSQNHCSHQVRTVPLLLNYCRKPWGWGKIPPNSQKITHFPHQKNRFNRFKSFAVKSFISSPSSNHLLQSLFVAAVISVVSCFKLQALCTHMSC